MSGSMNLHDRGKEKLPTAVLTSLHSIVICFFFPEVLVAASFCSECSGYLGCGIARASQGHLTE